VRVAPLIVPVPPVPELSVAFVPEGSSKPQAPTRPGSVAGLTVSETATVFGDPVAPGVVAVTVTVAV
jgi:hypothetical protein